MKFDLKDMNRNELETLAREVEAALENLRKEDLKRVRAEMEKLAAAHGVSVAEVMGGRGPKGTKAKSAPKYANPDDPTQTWTGKGRQPDWYKAALSAGKTPESMAL
ncbi:H-NS histone family protein [Thalassorhabdomicrobium marinisediminis]|uniref:H-NS histone family protein n=1 Tax=Thalassorhabdomicrobium marinisediminis TaxID=2170577 RepID=UPI002493B68B|nr:H-NS histone family protein [Thalassorhabdomicrobium marinisediminis]